MQTNRGHSAANDLGSPWIAKSRAGQMQKGRGAVSNVSGRFEALERSLFHDGWSDGTPAAPLKTEITDEFPKSVISRNTSPDVPFDRSVNPYRGCEHGCVYCFARPTHAYMGMSPGQDFESRLFAKPQAAELLEKELAKPNYKVAPIALGTNTDPYQPIEKQRRITRQILKVLAKHDHPVTILTKSRLVVRDLDILAPMAERGLVKVGLSVTTLDRKLARALEPRASMPQRRLDAIRLLSDADIPTSVMFAPVIPALNDHEMEQVLAAAAHAGAQEAGYILLRLPLEVAPLFEEWLEVHYPDRKSRVLNRLKSLRGGRLNDPRFKHRMRGKGFEADLMGQRFKNLTRRLQFKQERRALETDLFRPPEGDQLGFNFDISAA
ncbi:MAG: PA0069 family radical SAM protein [Kordiimonadaceae bacterium]|nr:PA0069 family radical SAM protein [Kordiimonadaceae bacterium]MBO6567171.1 PA0069 family radical SAM protein [Kordiimonadaceae bacterium]MBO6963614.1 PA0069 family radical SAM protein [Kordiimonadaceae bacterium]